MGSFELAGSGAGITALVSWTETVLEEENASLLEVDIQIKSSLWYGVSYFLSGTAAGRTFDSSTDYVYLGSKNAYYPPENTPITMKVEHNMDGTGTATIALELTGVTRSGSAGSGWKLQGSRTVELTPIIRASTVSATDADVGAVSVIAVSRKNDAYCHSLQYAFGALSGYLDSGGGLCDEPVMMTAATVPFTVPEEFYAQIPDRPSELCSITCTTFDGADQIGLPVTATFTVTADPLVCAPVVTGSVRDVHEATVALTGDPQTLIRFCSAASCRIAAEAQKEATIVSRTVEGVDAPAQFDEVEQSSFLFTATDSRGYESRHLVTASMIPYIKPTLNISCRRTETNSGSALLTARGSWFGGSFGAVENSLLLTVTVDGVETVLSPQLDARQFSIETQLQELDYAQSHTISVTATDLLCSVAADLLLSSGVPVFDWGKKDFAFHVPITAPRINGIRNLSLKAWPIGSVMLTAENISPAASIGGKWERLENIGLELNFWQRLQGADLLGTAQLGTMVLGEEA